MAVPGVKMANLWVRPQADPSASPTFRIPAVGTGHAAFDHAHGILSAT